MTKIILYQPGLCGQFMSRALSLHPETLDISGNNLTSNRLANYRFKPNLDTWVQLNHSAWPDADKLANSQMPATISLHPLYYISYSHLFSSMNADFYIVNGPSAKYTNWYNNCVGKLKLIQLPVNQLAEKKIRKHVKLTEIEVDDILDGVDSFINVCKKVAGSDIPLCIPEMVELYTEWRSIRVEPFC